MTVRNSVAVAVLGSLALAGGLEWWWYGRLSWEAHWNARIAAWTLIALVLNLVVVWWYARLTQQLRDVAGKQVSTANKQFKLARQQRSEANKPFVIIDWRRRTDCRLESISGEQHNYVLANIAPGLALNVDCAFVGRQGELEVHTLGALGGNQESVLPSSLENELRQAAASAHVVVIAEAIFKRTQHWNMTGNVVAPRGGRARHRLLWEDSVQRQHDDRTVDSWLRRVWPDIDRLMRRFEEEDVPDIEAAPSPAPPGSEPGPEDDEDDDWEDE